MRIQSRWTVVFLLLASVAFAITATGNFLTVWAWVAGGLFLVLAFLFAGRTDSQASQKPVWLILFLMVLLVLMVTLFSFLRYQPALGAAPGYTVQNVTDPGWVNGRFKSLQAITEQVPCTYTLLGWLGENTLYYQATCGGTEQEWLYDLASEEAEKVATLPDDLYTMSIPVSAITDSLLANVYPPELATVSRQTFITGEPLVTENGRYTALVSRHVYGPQDVLILATVQ